MVTLADYSPSTMTRDELIRALVRIDGNGVWTDADSVREGYQPMTVDEARQALVDLLGRE